MTECSLANAQAAEVLAKATENLFKLAFVTLCAYQKPMAWCVALGVDS